MDVKSICEVVDGLFTKRSSFMLLLQDIAENFYVERADFTLTRSLGNDFAGNLMTSYPLFCRRDLADQIGQMLRPTAKEWFHSGVLDPARDTTDARRWLQYADTVMRRAMFDPPAMFTRAAKEADNDYATFGQYCKRIRLNKARNGLLFTTYHLRDMVWKENGDGQIYIIARKFKPTARDLALTFANVSPKITRMIAANQSLEEVNCLHMMVQSDIWDGNPKGKPWVSIFYDADNAYEMEAVPVWTKQYAVARWQTVSGSQYAFSPATICALPEARLIQAITYTLLEAGEKSTNPPMIATHDVVRSDVNIYPGGITWVDRDYDERLGEALRPLPIDRGGLPGGAEQMRDSRAMIMQAFYLNKLTLPQRAPEMTAYEVGQRVQEYIRGALPLFEPMEYECNGQECEEVFDLMMRNGAFGSPADMPKSLQGAEFHFQFTSPLHDAIEQVKGQKFNEAKQLIAEAVALDQSAAATIDATIALRDTLMGIGVPAKWIRTEVEVEDIKAQQQAAAQAQQTLAAMQQGADVAGTMATAQKDRAMAETAVAA